MHFLVKLRGNISNTRKSVSSGYPNTEKCVEVFGYPDETLFRAFNIQSQTNQYLKRKLR